MAIQAKVSYDEENDILWIHSGEKVKDSMEVDKFVIDFSHDDKVVGVEIFDASDVLSKMSMVKINKNNLNNVLEAKFSSHLSKELFYVVIHIALMVNNEKLDIPISIPAPKAVVA